MALRTFFVVLSLFLLLHGPTTSGLLAVQTGACRYRKWESPGDVKLLVLAGLHESTGDRCGTVSKSVAPLVVAVEWALAILNGQRGQNGDRYIPGLTIGYDLYDTCDSVAMTTDILYTGSSEHVDCTNMTSTTDIYLGSISLTTDESTLVISRLIRDLPVLRPLPSSPLLDHSEVANLFQTVVSFQREAKAIVDALHASDWTFVSIIHSGDDYGTQTALEMQAMMKAAGICVSLTGRPDAQSLSNLFRILTDQMINRTVTVVFLGTVTDALGFLGQVKDTNRPHASRISWVFTSNVARHPEVKRAIQSEDHYVSVEYATYDDNEYETYLNEVNNGAINSPLLDIAKGTNEYSQASVDLVVDAVTAIVHAAKRLRSSKCQDDGAAICDNFTNSLSEELAGVVKEGFTASVIDNNYRPPSHGNRSVKFTASGNRDDLSLEVMIHSTRMSPNSNLVGVADESGGYTPKIANGKLPTSACASQCLECVNHLDMRYSYLHGDVLILGLFSLHTYGDTPFSCGAIRREINDPITVSAFMETIKLKRKSTNIVYGGLAIDDCYLAMNTTNYLGDLFSKKLIITDPQTGSAINFDNVVLIVGALSSSVTVVVADFATNLGLPMLSYSASSPELDNRNRYPYFHRTVPSDTLQAKGIVELVASLNVTRVGAVYIDDSYGKAGITQLLEYAHTKNICVVEPISVTQEDSLEALENNVVKRLYNTLQVRVVVFFAFDSIAIKIAGILTKDAYNSQPLIFVASEGWGTNQKLIENTIGMRTKGSIVFNIGATSIETQWYQTFLQNLAAASYVNNKWVPTFFEDYFKCNFLSSFEKDATYGLCSEAKKKEKLNAANVEALETDQRAVHTMLVVSAAVEAYEYYCRTVAGCSPSSSRRHPDSLMSAISDVTIEGRKLFDVDGNGNVGYTIFNIQMDRDTSKITYEKIGTYTKDGDLALSSRPVFYNDYDKEIPLSTIGDMLYCDYSPEQCIDVCLSPVTMTTSTETPGPVTPAPSNSTDTTLLIVVIITGILTLVLAAALILVVCLLLRRSNALYEMSKQVTVHGRGDHSRQSQDNIYHTPSDSVRSISKIRPQSGKYDNPAFEVTSVTPASGGSRSSMEFKPVQYAAISQTSLDIPRQSTLSLPVHSRQWSDLGPGPQSPPEWADLSRPWKRPGAADQMDDFRSTRSLSPAVFTPNSAPTQTSNRSTQDTRDRAQSSPRFRFSNLRDGEQSFTDDDPRANQVVSQCEGRELTGYLAPGSGNATNPEEESKITYLSAKDFVNTSGDEEEEEDEDSVPFSVLSTSLTIDSEGRGVKSIGYDPKLISPSNDEIIGINYPSEHTNSYPRVPKTFKPAASRSQGRSKTSDPGAFIDSLGDSFPESPVDEGVCIDDIRAQVQGSKPVCDDNRGSKSNARGYRGGETRSPGVSSISDVPDIIKHRAYEEENVFII